MGKYAGLVAGYSSNAEVIKGKLNVIKLKYQNILNNFGVTKVDGNLEFHLAEGDYLTDNVVNTIDTSISDIESIIADIDGRISSLSAEANRLDELEAQRLAQLSNDNDDNNDDNNDDSTEGGTNDD